MKGKEHLLPHDVRHLKNLSGPVGLQGWYKGIFYKSGVPQISKERQEKIQEKLEVKGILFHDPFLK